METEGYHKRKIAKGTYGDISKVQEEIEEFLDSKEQGIKLMEMLELADIYGALEAVVETYGITIEDIKMMSDVTKKAFKNGRR